MGPLTPARKLWKHGISTGLLSPRSRPQESQLLSLHSSVGKESACNAGDLGSIPGLGRSPGEENGNSFQYSCLENPMDWGAWWATVHGVSKSWTWQWLSMHGMVWKRTGEIKSKFSANLLRYCNNPYCSWWVSTMVLAMENNEINIKKIESKECSD